MVSQCRVLARRQRWVRDNQNDVSRKRTGRRPSLAEWTRGSPRGAEPADLLVSRSSGLHRCTSHPAARPHLGSGEGKSVFLGFRHPELGRDALSLGWDTCHLSGMDPEDRGQQRSACLCPCFPKDPLSPAPSWLSPLRNPLLGNPAFYVCGHAGRPRWCHSPHLAPGRTRDAASVQGNTDGDFYGGSDQNLRYRFW